MTQKIAVHLVVVTVLLILALMTLGAIVPDEPDAAPGHPLVTIWIGLLVTIVAGGLSAFFPRATVLAAVALGAAVMVIFAIRHLGLVAQETEIARSLSNLIDAEAFETRAAALTLGAYTMIATTVLALIALGGLATGQIPTRTFGWLMLALGVLPMLFIPASLFTGFYAAAGIVALWRVPDFRPAARTA